MLEYCECFEDGYERSSDMTFKAFIRRSKARKERKDYVEAMSDVKESLKLFPNDQNALNLKEEIE